MTNLSTLSSSNESLLSICQGADRCRSVTSTSNRCPSDISQSKNELPSQPVLPCYKQNKDKRSFHSQWYTNRPWLEYSIIQDKAYCYYCRHYGTSIAMSRNQNDAFLTGFRNWKKALEKDKGLKLHESCIGHLQATVNYQESVARSNTNRTVVDILDSSRSQQVKRNREKISKIASAILLCARQMIALRGHNENET
jgi:hypothetical protein